jgi:GNAT superfamily N-acetyltransferase
VAFQNHDEKEAFGDLLSYRRLYGSQLLVFPLVLMCEEEVVGGVVFDYFNEHATLAIEFIAVLPTMRKRGVAKFLVNHVIQYVKDCGYEPKWLMLEIDKPGVSGDADLSYVYFWHKLGLQVVDFHYIQPPLSLEKEPSYGLYLCAKSLMDEQCTVLPAEVLRAFLDNYLTFAIRVEGQDCQILKRMLETTCGYPLGVPLKNLVADGVIVC